MLASVADRAAYVASTPFRNSLRKGLSRSAGAVLEEAAADLVQRSGRKTTNAAQEVMAESFGAKKQKRPSSLNKQRSKRW